MTVKACSDEEFMALFRSLGASGVSKALGVSVRSSYTRRRDLENKHGELLHPPTAGQWGKSYVPRIPIELQDGVILVGSDAHYWPDVVTTAHRAFVHFAKELQPDVICLNGDAVDGAGLSRHPPLGWEKKPTPKQEFECVDERLTELRDACKKSRRIFTIGNHDARFEIKMATLVPEMEGIPGFSLKDRLPEWEFGMSYWVNDDVVIKHRWKGGVHATHNNTVNSGKSFVTGHLHSLKVTPFSDYNGNRFGVDTGTLAEPYGPQFSYGEDNPLNHRSGFVVLTFHKGRLLWPEIVHVIGDGIVEFRGKVISV